MTIAKKGTMPVIFVLTLAGCATPSAEEPGEVKSVQEHAGWKAADFWEDAQVVALGNAIEADDAEAIDRLIAAGADVNAKGKKNVTPLLWAMFALKPERFKQLLEHGADPNVQLSGSFPPHIAKGDSVMHYVSISGHDDYFDPVMEHGGDPNLIQPSWGPPLGAVMAFRPPQRLHRAKSLIEQGMNLDQIYNARTPAMDAVISGNFDIAVMLLEAGADPHVYTSDSNNMQLAHAVVRRQSLAEKPPPGVVKKPLPPAFDRLVELLTEKNVDLDKAREDRERWKRWQETIVNDEKRMRLKREEVEARLVREAAEKEGESEDAMNNE